MLIILKTFEISKNPCSPVIFDNLYCHCRRNSDTYKHINTAENSTASFVDPLIHHDFKVHLTHHRATVVYDVSGVSFARHHKQDPWVGIFKPKKR